MPERDEAPAPIRSMPLHAAVVRFSTLERPRWPSVVRALRDVGFDAIDIPLVWREHERSSGLFEFQQGERSLAAMLDAVLSEGLRVVVRLGPTPGADLPGLGIPERVLRMRDVQARTRRQNAVLVPDPPRLVPMPSRASQLYRREVAAWIEAAAEALSRIESREPSIVRVMLGHGPHASLRDDPYEIDHHPDARAERAAIEPSHDGPNESALEEIARAARIEVEFAETLLAAAERGGIARDRVALAWGGAPAASPAAITLAAKHTLAVSIPRPDAGASAIWHAVRNAVALSNGRVHVELPCGSFAYAPPVRSSHAIEASRIAFAAGARDVSVQAACSSGRWIGSLCDERGRLRADADRWKELLAWARTLPVGDEWCVDLVESSELIAHARAATGVHPLPLGALVRRGTPIEALAVPDAPFGEGTVGACERALAEAETKLTERGLPARRTPRGTAEIAFDPSRDALDDVLARADQAFASTGLSVDPAGASCVRYVRAADALHAVVVASREVPVRVTAAAGAQAQTEVAPGDACVVALLLPKASASPRAARASRKPRKARS